MRMSTVVNMQRVCCDCRLSLQVLQDDKGVSKVSRVVYVSRLAKLPSSKHVEKWQNTIERIRGKSPSEGSVIRKAVVAALGQAIGRTDVSNP